MSQEVVETYLNDGALMMFAGSVDQAFKHDALNSCLYAQLSASKQFNKFTNYREWQTTLIKALTTFGWLRLDLADSQSVESEGFVVSNRLRELLPKSISHLSGATLDRLLTWLFTPEASKVAKVMIKRLEPVVSHENATSTEMPAPLAPVYSVVLQVAFLMPSRQQTLLCIAFETQQDISSDLFDQHLNIGKLVSDVRSFAFIGTLDDMRYSQYRERIDTALADRRDLLSFPIKGLSS